MMLYMMQLPKMEKKTKTLKQVIREEFGEVVPCKWTIMVNEPIQMVSDEELVELYGGFWAKLICGTSLKYVEFLRKWAAKDTFDKWIVA